MYALSVHHREKSGYISGEMHPPFKGGFGKRTILGEGQPVRSGRCQVDICTFACLPVCARWRRIRKGNHHDLRHH